MSASGGWDTSGIEALDGAPTDAELVVLLTPTDLLGSDLTLTATAGRVQLGRPPQPVRSAAIPRLKVGGPKRALEALLLGRLGPDSALDALHLEVDGHARRTLPPAGLIAHRTMPADVIPHAAGRANLVATGTPVGLIPWHIAFGEGQRTSAALGWLEEADVIGALPWPVLLSWLSGRVDIAEAVEMPGATMRGEWVQRYVIEGLLQRDVDAIAQLSDDEAEVLAALAVVTASPAAAGSPLADDEASHAPVGT